MSNRIKKETNSTAHQSQSLRIEDANLDSFKGEDNEVAELKRASQEINRSNRRIIKQTFNDDVLKIEENSSSKPTRRKRRVPPPSQKLKKSDTESTDDWETMYAENGDCLDPNNSVDGLTSALDKVTLKEPPKYNHKDYEAKLAQLNEEEYPHVLEISDFPTEFKTQDLMQIFADQKEKGFDIKWIDDTHALAVFSSARVAAEILLVDHPFVKLKPLSGAAEVSRMKAKKCSNSLQPYKPRPETCVALARRLVSGALGLKLETSKEERENEKRILREARERKLLAAKQRDEAWDG